MTPETEARAKQLFFDYDGSTFFMSRDGVDEEFEAFNVPDKQRREWMRELTAAYLEALEKRGNSKSVFFLSHHSNYSHVRDVLAARPLGVWWEQIAFLEEVLRYVREAGWLLRASAGDLARASEMAVRFGEPLLAKVSDPRKRRRVETLLEDARKRAKRRMPDDIG